MGKKLISVIVLSYNSAQYILEAINSILNQTYEEIELIICDDAGNDWTPEVLQEHINLRKKKNIKNVILHQNKRNLGTVRNMNVALKMAKGEIVCPFAADDVIANPTVLEVIANKFDTLDEDNLVLISQVAMCNQSLSHIESFFIGDKVKNCLRFESTEQLLRLEMQGSLLPSLGTFFRREVFEKYGYMDERYDLVEDWTYHLKLLKAGERFAFCDIVSFLHRDGGVSHGNASKNSSVSQRYEADLVKCYEWDILPYMDYFLSENEKKAVLHYYNVHKENLATLPTQQASLLERLWVKRKRIVPNILKRGAPLLLQFYQKINYIMAISALLFLFVFLFQVSPLCSFPEWVVADISIAAFIIQLGCVIFKLLEPLLRVLIHCTYLVSLMKTRDIWSYLD